MTAATKPLSQWGVRELARATGISPTTATRVKRGEGDFDGDTLRAVLTATGICMCCGATAEAAHRAGYEAARADAAKSGWYLLNYDDFMRGDKPWPQKKSASAAGMRRLESARIRLTASPQRPSHDIPGDALPDPRDGVPVDLRGSQALQSGTIDGLPRDRQWPH